MALKVWLPFNGDLKNHGLGTDGVGKGNITYSAGKIGQCIDFSANANVASGSENMVVIPGLQLPTFTFCAWIKVTSAATQDDQIIAREGQGYNTDGWSLIINKDTNKIAARASWISHTFSDTGEVNKWYHIAFTHANQVNYWYFNGELISSANCDRDVTYDTTTTSDGNVISFGARGRDGSYHWPFQGCINDFRLYDEALSPKQIKEISKGLVAHYKLEIPNINTNLAVFNPLVNSGSTSISFDKSTNTYTLVAPVGDSTWGYGVNIGTTKKCIVPYNSYYRFSFEVYVPTEHELVVDYNNYSNDSSVESWNGNDNDLTSARLANIKTIPANTWTKCIFGSQNAHASNTSHIDIYEQSKIGLRTTSDTEPVTWYLRNFKFELDNKATDYVPYGYNPMEFLTTDVSGNGYNSIINGTLTYNNDSPRYEGCTKFDANTSYIKLPALTTGGFANSFTFIWWSNITDMNGRMAWGFSDGNHLNLYPTSSNYCCNTGDGGNNPYKDDGGNAITFSTYNNGWHQYAMVGDGITNKLYIDGQYKGKATTYKGITGTQIYISGWDASTSYTWTNGQISDWRLYATVLTADDILTLYKTSGIIDNNGNIYAYEFKEE